MKGVKRIIGGRVNRLGAVLVAALALCAGIAHAESCASPDVVTFGFPQPYSDYRASCIMDGGPLKIDICHGKKVRHLIYNECRMPVEVTPLIQEGRNGRNIRTILVNSSGGSVSHVYILAIDPRAGRIRKLTYGFDKGGVDYGYDAKHRLTGMRFHYWRWHVDADKPLIGHIFTAIDYKWIPAQQKFHVGNPQADKEAEAKASLLDMVTAFGSEEYLGVIRATDKNNNTATYYYRPKGILRDKTPVKLRSAAKVKLTVKFDNDHKPRVISVGQE